jgi:hypothetical protein
MTLSGVPFASAFVGENSAERARGKVDASLCSITLRHRSKSEQNVHLNSIAWRRVIGVRFRRHCIQSCCGMLYVLAANCRLEASHHEEISYYDRGLVMAECSGRESRV